MTREEIQAEIDRLERGLAGGLSAYGATLAREEIGRLEKQKRELEKGGDIT